jgi:hypothetical protein
MAVVIINGTATYISVMMLSAILHLLLNSGGKGGAPRLDCMVSVFDTVMM